VFLVCEEGSLPHAHATGRLEYCFSAAEPEQAFGAWQVGDAAHGSQFAVAEKCRQLTGGFAQQALNRPVAAALMRTEASVLVISGLWGCTIDLPRIADMLGIPTLFVIPREQEFPDHLDASTAAWVQDAFQRCRFVAADELPPVLRALVEPDKVVGLAAWPDVVAGLSARRQHSREFNYSTYEFLSRDHPLLHAMQYRDVRFFAGCERVLDVACGAGIFLDCLRTAGIDALGVERDSMIAEYGAGMGLDIINQDAMEYLGNTGDSFDGIYCSHFVEHLPIETVQELIGLLYQRLLPGGLLVLVFPDPESIRSQLLGFWRDPEHVRFYHPELVSSIATVAGFSLESTSYDEQPHTVVGFEATPPQPPALSSLAMPPVVPAKQSSGLDKLLGLLGLQSRHAAQCADKAWRDWSTQVINVLANQNNYLEHLTQRSDKLWQVNATWSWNDNATLLLRRSDT